MKLAHRDFRLWEYNINGQKVHSKHFAVDGFLRFQLEPSFWLLSWSLLLPNEVYSKLKSAVGMELYDKTSFSNDLTEIPLLNCNEMVTVVGKWVGNPASRKFVAMHEMRFSEIQQKMNDERSCEQVSAFMGIFTVSFDQLQVSGAFLLSNPDGKGTGFSRNEPRGKN